MPSLDVLQPPDCPHLVGGNLCGAAWSLTGVVVPVTAPVCNVTCQASGGPYAGRATTDGQGWGRAMLLVDHRRSLAKVRQRYGGGTPVDVRVPAATAAVRAAFAPMLALPWVTGLGLSGSCLIAGTTATDLDVVLFATDLATAARPTLAVPATVAGLKVDLFVKPGPAGVYMVLDLGDMKLYANGLYTLGTVDPQITGVVQTGADQYAPPVVVEEADAP